MSDREGGRFSAAALRVGSWPHPPPAWSTASSRGTPESRLKPPCWAYSFCGSIPGRAEGSVAVLNKGHLRVGVARGASYRLPGWCCLGQLGTAFLIRAWGRFCVQCWGRRMGAQSWRRGSRPGGGAPRGGRAGAWGPGLTFQMLASLPYTTAMLPALPPLMSCFSVSLSSSDTKPMKELSGV